MGATGLGVRLVACEATPENCKHCQEAGDPGDLISGHNEAGKAAIKEAHARQAALIADLLEPCVDTIARTGQTPAQLARFVVTVAMDLQYGSENRSRLDELLHSLRSSVIALTASE